MPLPPANTNLLSSSIARIKQDLGKPNCAKDFTNVNAASADLSNVTITNLGTLTFQSQGAQVVATNNSAPLARQNPLTGSIQLNSAVNWASPNSTAATQNGKPYTYPAESSEAAYLGVSSITASQFMDITILHELAHYKGIQNPDSQSFEKKLWNDCVQ